MLVKSSTPWKCEGCANLVNVTIYPCGVCHSHVPEDNYSILCSYCDHWIHLLCTGLTEEQLMSYEGNDVYYACPNCVFPFHYTDISVGSSFIKDSDNESSFLSVISSVNSIQSEVSSPRDTLCASINQSHPKNFKIAHLNINSFKHKFYDCEDILHSGVFDIIGFSETKLGPSFQTSQYKVPGYKSPFRVDGSTHSGGLLLYFKDSIQCILRQNLQLPSFQSLVCDFTVNNRNWCLFHVYRPPSYLKDTLNIFYTQLQASLDKAYAKYDNVILFGDINIDLLNSDVSTDYNDLLDAFAMKNLIKEPTCFKNKDKPTCLDHMVTNKSCYFKTTGVLDTGLSDFHRLTYMVLKIHRPKPTRYTTVYRATKGVDQGEFVESLSHCPFHIMDIFSDVEDKFYVFDSLYSEVVNDFYPVKARETKKKFPPYVNNSYRKSIYKKAQLDNKRRKYPSPKNFEAFRVLRNKCSKMRNSALRGYLTKKCSGGAKGGGGNFGKQWDPFLVVNQ